MRVFTQEEQNYIFGAYDSGETIKSIREHLKCKGSTLNEFLRASGRGKRRKNTLKDAEFLKNGRKYHVNESYFRDIDNPNKAYWLGFLYADGYVFTGKGGYVQLTLAEVDENHIFAFLYDIGSNHPVKHKVVTCTGKSFRASTVSVNSVEMANDLASHGCVQAKSLILKPPDIPRDLIPHFIRGYMDGDGSVGYYPDYGSYSFSATGTKNMLEFIRDESGVSKRISIRKINDENAYTVNFSGKSAVETFFSYIYSDRPIFLERKWDKALKMMKHLDFDTHRSPTAALADLLD